MNKQEAKDANKKNIIDALRAAGVSSVVVTYNGGGDSGQLEEVTGLNKEGQPVDIPNTVIPFIVINWSWASGQGYSHEYDHKETSLPFAIETFFWFVLGELHGGWENNDGGQGEFTINVDEGTFSLHHEQNYVEHFTSDDVV